VLQRYSIMQPVIAGAGAVEILLAWLWQRRIPAINVFDSKGCSERGF